MDCCNIASFLNLEQMKIVTIPRTVWTVATANNLAKGRRVGLRYRERYGLLQLPFSMSCPSSQCYDTANGMDCCNSISSELQYAPTACYDTANGMDCCNNNLLYRLITGGGYDTANGMDCCNSGASEAPKSKGSEGAFSKIRPKIADFDDFGRGHCFKIARKMPTNSAISRLERVHKRSQTSQKRKNTFRCLYYKAFWRFCQSFR